MHTKKSFCLLSLLLVFLLVGCAYQLRYSVSAKQHRETALAAGRKTFALRVHKVRDYPNSLIEEELLSFVEQSLVDNGWKRVPAREADYIFSVDFEPEKKRITGEFGFSTSPGRGSGIFIGAGINLGGRKYYKNFIWIIAYSQEEQESYVWSAECITRRTRQDITALARYMIPFAISQFPEEGYWERKEKVKLHKR